MIITLKGATFTHKLNLNVWLVNSSLVGVTSSNTASSVTKGDPYTTTFTIQQGFKIDANSTVSVVCNGQTYPLNWSSTEAGGTASLEIDEVTAPITITVKASTVSGTVVNPDTGDDNEDPVTPPATGETVTFTLDTATTASTTEMVHTSQSIGSAVAYHESGTRGVVTWDIPAYASVTLTVATGGSYGMALTDRNNIVLASTPTANATDGTIVFPIQTVPTRVHASKAKFTSGSYTTYSEEEMKGMELSVGFTGNVTGKYVDTYQTVGSPIAFADLSSASYNISNTIPANTQVTITCKETTAGGYGMALCDTSGNVIEYINHKDTASTDSKHTFTAQTVETKLYVSVNKFVSATYKVV